MSTDKIYSIDEIKQLLNENKEFLEKKFCVKSFLLFGSYAKNLQNTDSDIDLLVDLSEPIDMFDFIDLQDYLSQLFNKKIDLGTIDGLKDFVRNSVLKDAVML